MVAFAACCIDNCWSFDTGRVLDTGRALDTGRLLKTVPHNPKAESGSFTRHRNMCSTLMQRYGNIGGLAGMFARRAAMLSALDYFTKVLCSFVIVFILCSSPDFVELALAKQDH